ncbi:hypothetical protein BP6252_01207 [Coleophoma cylindrospora]|uniref:RBR-type E3 ubiquitin transferase n=1 Tax=Coleophoma cylindrospora TaxID=1849047 RepID=A0A3D8SSA3_9HELO|nr:hypothetical protein BP6252_01207 [Coleophoma cylindrospora]
MDDDDEREIELSSITAIYPEIILNPEDPFSAYIELPVHPTNPVTVSFPASYEGPGDINTPPHPTILQENGLEPSNNIESHNLEYLPALQLRIRLPDGYPADKPPRFELSTSPAWLSEETLERLVADGERLWEELGHDQVVFTYIDHLQQAAETGFGTIEGEVLQVPQEHKISLLDYDLNEAQAAFERGTFECGVCLDPRKGSVCHKMMDCGHVFCVQCLQDFYNNAITEGDLISVRCLAPDCAKKRGEAQVASKKYRKPKTQLNPSELLQIPLDHDIVTRYVHLKHKADLESDKNTIYCPRTWCQGAAKSKKHRKPEGLEIVESDDESETETDDKGYKAGRDLLSICEDCSFAFCSRCFQGWHGEFKSCIPRNKNGELSEEDKASLEYLNLHTTPCPTCAARAQKTHGCNHMICFKCNTHFCYLCSAWLEPTNPYKHYNVDTTGCYQRLWELIGGDGDDVGIEYGGGVGGLRPENLPVEEVGDEDEPRDHDQVGDFAEIIPDIEEPDDEHQEVDRAPVQREGPLVFRLNVPPPPPPAAPMAPELVDPRQIRGRGGRRRGGRQAVGGRNVVAPPNDDQEAIHRAWVQRFVQMALNDEEDQVEWDSDDEEDRGAWEIPVR